MEGFGIIGDPGWLPALAVGLGIVVAFMAGRLLGRRVSAHRSEAPSRPADMRTGFHLSDPTSPIGHLGAAFHDMAARLGLSEAEREPILRALREGEERLQVAQDIAGLGVWDWDHRSGRIAWSPQMFRVTGLAVDRDADLLGAWLGVLYPEDRDRMERDVVNLPRTLEPLTAEYRIVKPDGSLRWLLMRAQSLPDGTGQPLRTVIVNLDITPSKESEARERFLLGLSDRIGALVHPREILTVVTEALGCHLGASRVGYGETDSATMALRVLADWHAQAVPDQAGGRHVVPFGSALCAELKEGRTVIVEDALSDPRTEGGREAYEAAGERASLSVPLLEEGQVQAVLYLHSATPRHWSACEVELCRDVAERTWAAFERARANARQRLLVNELNHRVKNTLATVQSIAAQSFRAGPTEAARDAFEARLFALSKTHDVLTRENWEGANLYDIVDEALAPYRKDPVERFRIDGHPLQLPPRMALSLAMAIHELSTNAAKYGAFSSDAGQVVVHWKVAEAGKERSLTLQWREEGGPMVRPPARKGFGSRLIERSLTRELAGKADLDYRPDGLVCTLYLPLPEIQADAGEADILGFC
jgi:PAS domain S-box-containing protein